jgi:D-alanyl-D-alanine carboxypeptidase
MVMDMRTGEVLASRNADTPLHPASLTKMMTLYICFEAIAHGEIGLDDYVTVSANAAAEPPSHLGLRKGQKIKLRYLIRAAAVKSANDAATAIGEAIEGSEAAFARRMNRTAQELGMTRSHFMNANGLTRQGHMSTARDMTILGRHLFFDWPQYYNLFSRRTADVGGHEVANTNTRFLNAYRGADGIKTGYTSASGFNLVASAKRGDVRIIATVFGGTSTAARNAKMAQLMDLGFRKAPKHAAVRRPARPPYLGPISGGANDPAIAAAVSSGKVVRVVAAPTRSIRPEPRPSAAPEAPAPALVAKLEDGVDNVVAGLVEAPAVAPVPPPRPATLGTDDPVASAETDDSQAPAMQPQAVLAAARTPVTAPAPADTQPEGIILTADEPDPVAEQVAQEVVTRMSTSGGHHWGINVGLFGTQFEAERTLLKTALVELPTLGTALRKVARTPRGFDANFVGLTQDRADLACRRLEARSMDCKVIGPTG